MTCNNCEKQTWFWKKIGRCMRCVQQLTLLSIIATIAWWILFRDTPRSIESIALLMALASFVGLLGLHLWMRFIVFPLRGEKPD